MNRDGWSTRSKNRSPGSMITLRLAAVAASSRESVPRGLYFFKRFYTEHEPYGVVGIIGPWNYPIDLMVPPIVAALLAGNTVLVKPSEVAAATGVLLETLINRVPGLAPYVRFLHGDARVGQAVVRSRPDLLFLTGSVKTGRVVARMAAEDMTPFLYELGGKDPMLVLEDADVAAAAKWGVWGAFYSTGQACVSVESGSEFRTVDSQQLEGTWTAIFFWPLDFTYVCPTELVEFNRALREFRALGARVYGVSGDSHHAHLAWRKEHPALRNLEFPMVADADKVVAEELGDLGSQFGEVVVHERAVVCQERHLPEFRGTAHRRDRIGPRRHRASPVGDPGIHRNIDADRRHPGAVIGIAVRVGTRLGGPLAAVVPPAPAQFGQVVTGQCGEALHAQTPVVVVQHVVHVEHEEKGHSLSRIGSDGWPRTTPLTRKPC